MAFTDSPLENMLATEPVVSFMDFSKITNLLLYYKGGGAVSCYGARFPPSPTVLSVHPRSSSLRQHVVWRSVIMKEYTIITKKK